MVTLKNFPDGSSAETGDKKSGFGLFFHTCPDKVGIVTSESSRSMSVHRHRSTAIWKTKTDKTYGGKDKGYTTIYDMSMIKNKYR